MIKGLVLSKALAYYRCTFQQELQTDRINKLAESLLAEKISTPSLYLHGENDGCIGHYLYEGMENFFEHIVIKIVHINHSVKDKSHYMKVFTVKIIV